MKSWLVLKSPERPIGVIDADDADTACIKAARRRNDPGTYMAVEWNPIQCQVRRNRSENWAVTNK